MSLLDSALAYAGQGWQVFPCWWPGDWRPCACPNPQCSSPAKHPHGETVPNGLKDATTDQATISGWWGLVPRANIAIATGAVSGLVVLDVDGPEGEANLRRLLEAHGKAAKLDALWARSGAGGWHAYMGHPGREVRNSTGKLGARIDVKGDGGCLTAPPSLHVSGRRYEWVKGGLGSVLPPMPEWLFELVEAPTPASALRRPVHLTGRGSAYGLAALRAETVRVGLAMAGTRNDSLFRSAARLGELVGGGVLQESDVIASLLDAARAAGLAGREAEATVRSGLRHGLNRPRQIVR